MSVAPPHHRQLRALARQRVCAQDVDDLVFETLSVIIRMERERGAGVGRAYALGICMHLASRWARARKRWARAAALVAAAPAATRDPETALIEHQLAERAVSVLRSLPEAQRTTFERAALEGMSAAEIAATDGVPEATVRSRLFHARQKLRRALKELEARARVLVVLALLGSVLLVGGVTYALSQPQVRAWLLKSFTRTHPPRQFLPVRGAREARSPPSSTFAETGEDRAGERPRAHGQVELLPVLAPPRPVRRPRAPPLVSGDLLFDQASAAQFRDRDSERALVLWQSYLARFPDGRFAPEARYNQAVALVRVGELPKARAALEQIASGKFGPFRREDAAVLLERLEAGLR